MVKIKIVFNKKSNKKSLNRKSNKKSNNTKMDKKTGTYLSLCNSNYKKKDDDWETPAWVLSDLKKIIPAGSVIYDPFYCDGYVKKQWAELGYDCINNDVDAFDLSKAPSDFDYIVSNIPFSLKQQVFKFFSTNYPDKPILFLIPTECMSSKWILPYFDKLQFIISNGRYSFYKKSQQKISSFWKNTCWYCFNCNLPEKLIKIE